MNRKQILLLTGGLLALIIILLVIRYVFQPASKTVEREKPDYTLEASDLVKEFETDEESANALYRNKIVQVSGIIDNITEDKDVITITLKNPGSVSGTICSFNKSTVMDKKFEIGSRVDIKGVCDGYLLDVVMTRCALVE
jgi:predicted phosphodiesterase